MIRIPVKSSLIKSVGHDERTNEMQIEFIRGGVFTFPGIQKGEYMDLLVGEGQQGSVGRYFLRNIKPRFEQKRSWNH